MILIAPHPVEACGSPNGPWVELRFGPGDWSALAPRSPSRSSRPFQITLQADLQAGLRQDSGAVCQSHEGPNTHPETVVRLELGTELDLQLRVETGRGRNRVALRRSLDLSEIPEEGRGLAVALAADELIAASAAERAVKEEEALKTERQRHEENKKEASGEVRLGGGAAGQWYSSRYATLGMLVNLCGSLGEDWEWLVAAAGRQGQSISSTHGEVSAQALGLGVGLRLIVAQHPQMRTALGVDVHSSWLALQAQANALGSGTSATDLSVFARTHLHLRFPLSKNFAAELQLGLGLPLRAVEALDQGEFAAGFSGLELSVHPMLAWRVN